MDKCEICDQDSTSAGKLQKVHEKGYKNLKDKCRQLNEISLLEQLDLKWNKNICIKVHSNCRSILMQKVAPVDVIEQNYATLRVIRKTVQATNENAEKGKGKNYIQALIELILPNFNNRSSTFIYLYTVFIILIEYKITPAKFFNFLCKSQNTSTYSSVPK